MSCCLRLSAWSLIWNSAAARWPCDEKHILKVWHRMAWHWRKAFLKLGWTWSFLCFLCFLFYVFCDSLRLWASDPLFRSVLDAFHMQNLKQSSPSKFTQQSCDQGLAMPKYRAEMFKESNPAKCSTPALASQSKRQGVDIRSAFGVFDVFELWTIRNRRVTCGNKRGNLR